MHWLDDAMPLQTGGDQCAVLMRIDTTQWGGRCHRLPVVEVRWRFKEGVTVLRLCADHADVLMGNDRCLQVRSLEVAGAQYDADVED